MSAVKDKVNLSDFDEAAAVWDNEPRRVRLAEEIAEAIKKNVSLNKDMRVFEFGCGTGLLGFLLSSDVKELVMADNSRGMIEVLSDKVERSGADNIRPLLLDLMLETHDDVYDLVMTSLALHHVDDYKRLTGIFSSLIKKGGTLCIADLDTEDGSFHGEDVQVHKGFDREHIKEVLGSCGFSDLKSKTVHHIEKSIEDGSLKSFPVFMITGTKA